MKLVELNTVNKKSINYKKYFAVVDDEDYEKVIPYKWSFWDNGYAVYASAKINDKVLTMHKFLTGFNITDHKDGNGLNNQRCNLREASHSQNMANTTKKAVRTSRYKGVSWDRFRNKWRVTVRGKALGRFDCETKAAIVYDKNAIRVFGEFANPNLLNTI